MDPEPDLPPWASTHMISSHTSAAISSLPVNCNSPTFIPYAWISPLGAKRIFWRILPREHENFHDYNTGYFRIMDVTTRRQSALLQFTEEVEESLSPDGTRVLAIGTRSGTLYVAQLSQSGTEWTVERLGPK